VDDHSVSSAQNADVNPAQALEVSETSAREAVDLQPYDAVILVSFGGPERAEQVVPFLENVTRGRGIPRDRLVEVGQHYFAFGGRSPINDQCRALLMSLRETLSRGGCEVPLYWGNRNWDPFLAEEFARLKADGHHRVLAITTSAYPCYSSCRQYRENLYEATAGLGLSIDRVRQYATHPGFVAASVDAVYAALDELGATGDEATLVYVTHSIPTTMAQGAGPDGDGYVTWHRAVAAEITRQVSERRAREYEHDLAYCSRSGPEGQPWLEPDVNDRLRELHADGVAAVVLVPIGFVSDHMEVAYDLDTEAAETAAELGLAFVRAATAGVHPAFVSGLVDVLAERARAARGETYEPAVIRDAAIGRIECPADCCPNLREPGKPALCQAAAR
jgi:protoporphyrin/coproporphyrin ferrochelatase